MPALPAPEVALLLREFGQRTALRGGNPYRSKAYIRAAENLLALTEPLEDLVAEGRLTEIPGVGDAIADIITKLHKTGDHPSLQSMRKEMPADALEMLSIPGLRPDKVAKNLQGAWCCVARRAGEGGEGRSTEASEGTRCSSASKSAAGY